MAWHLIAMFREQILGGRQVLAPFFLHFGPFSGGERHVSIDVLAGGMT